MRYVQNKMIRKTIIVLVVLLVVIGDLVYYKSKDPGNVDTETVDLIKVGTGKLDKVVVYDNSDEEVVIETSLKNKGNGIELEKREAKYKEDAQKRDKDLKGLSKVEENTIKLFEYTITNLQALKLIEKDAINLEQYGFNSPMCVVDITLKDGQNKGFIIGNTTVTANNAYYLKMQNDNTVYTISKWDVNNILFTKENIVDVNL